jgi:hypothetical protein
MNILKKVTFTNGKLKIWSKKKVTHLSNFFIFNSNPILIQYKHHRVLRRMHQKFYWSQ